jgi:hypothetical protein
MNFPSPRQRIRSSPETCWNSKYWFLSSSWSSLQLPEVWILLLFFFLSLLTQTNWTDLSDRIVYWWSGIYYSSQPKDYLDVEIVINWTINQRNCIRDRKEKSQNCQNNMTQNIYQTNKIWKIINGLFGSYLWMFITYLYKLVAYKVPTTLQNIGIC